MCCIFDALKCTEISLQTRHTCNCVSNEVLFLISLEKARLYLALTCRHFSYTRSVVIESLICAVCNRGVVVHAARASAAGAPPSPAPCRTSWKRFLGGDACAPKFVRDEGPVTHQCYLQYRAVPNANKNADFLGGARGCSVSQLGINSGGLRNPGDAPAQAAVKCARAAVHRARLKVKCASTASESRLRRRLTGARFLLRAQCRPPAAARLDARPAAKSRRDRTRASRDATDALHSLQKTLNGNRELIRENGTSGAMQMLKTIVHAERRAPGAGVKPG
ncbi:hypothetical protein EVAR_99806_1 [Eumeta japonica]|uniref:Uncharacterized protein n=1 Tax=Eumeta variegata TaxID=151549 RepID=A0A4C1ZF24_EUMVA|nr:hypothetical protein EVAR_99806_1 [Eumeta japonica]